MTKWLLSHGASPISRDISGNDVLSKACFSDSEECLKLLEQHMKREDVFTSGIMAAASSGALKVLAMLLKECEKSLLQKLVCFLF